MTAPDGEVVVRHCAVRVVRRGGWSWGPVPEQLPRRILDLLPELLVQRYATELAGGEDVEITEPVTIVVPVSLAGTRWPPGSPAPVVPAPAGSAPVPAAPTGPLARTVRGGPRAVTGASPAGGPDLAEVLRGLLDEGGLALWWELVPEAVRTRYATAFRQAGTGPGDPVRDPPGQQPAVPPVTAATDPPGAEAPGGATAPAGSVAARGYSEVEVGSALPFLLAAALARIGVLDAIGPVLAGAGLAEDLSLFATALAYRALGPVERGWLRSATDRMDAAVFAGLDAEVPDDALVSFARRAAPALPVLDGLVGLALCRGHEPGTPLVLAEVDRRYGGGLLLVEPAGLFPVAWVDSVDGVLPYWRACGYPPVVLNPGSGSLVPVAAELADGLAAAGVPLACGTAPARGERPWRRVPGPGRWWVTGPVPAGGYGPVGRLDVAGVTAGLDDLITAMARRPTVPRTTAVAFERTVTLVATLALGTVAWLLWTPEVPDPQLTLRRLGNLGGLVRFEPDSVRVRLPLGARYADLDRHRLLADVPAVAWLGDRTLTFSGG